MNADFTAVLASEFFGNPVSGYLYAVILFAVSLAVIYFLRRIVFARLNELASRTETDLDDLAMDLINMVRPPEYGLVALYLSVRHLNRSPGFNKALTFVILVVFTYRAITLAQRLLNYWINKIAAQRGLTESATKSVVHSTQVILRALIWAAAILFVLDNLGVNVSAVLTGLGIGGVAVALAAQAILGDLFNFFVILLDKPFNIGDFVVSDAVSGTIEHIGLKSTRIRSISGEMVVVSNSNLLSSRIRNYKDLDKRRVVFKTGVTYRTPAEKLRKIPALIKDAVLGRAGTEFERSNLYETGDSSIDFETVYYITSGDYKLYMETQEQVLLAVLESFAGNGIAFAYPTQTIFVEKEAAAAGGKA
ncbi:MAG: mechanosensitive ion channel family protein [Elusimicrobiales bacterium]|jgi:small-conductance mechanosensitive channel